MHRERNRRVSQLAVERQMALVQRRGQPLRPVALVQRDRAGWDAGDEGQVEPDGEIAVPERRGHHPPQVVVETGHQRLAALEGDDVAFPEPLRPVHVGDDAADAPVVAGQPVELPGDALAGVGGDGQPPPQPGEDGANRRTPALERAKDSRALALDVEGEVGPNLDEPRALGVALETVGQRRLSSTKLKIGPAMEMTKRTAPTAKVARTDSEPTTLRATASTAESQRLE